MKFSSILIAMLLAVALTAPAFAQRSKLKEGDKAPGIDIETWYFPKTLAEMNKPDSGDDKEMKIEEGHAYVIEFWATWCGPCKRVAPILSAVEEMFSRDDFHVIGVTSEEESVVDAYLRRGGGDMAYTVAVDRRESTKRAWLDAAGLSGIPAAFIVDRHGVVQWIGNPLAETEEFLMVCRLVKDDRYDHVLFSQSAGILNAIESSRKMKNFRMCFKHIDDLLESDKRVFAHWAWMKYEIKLLDQQDPKAAAAYAQEMTLRYQDDPRFLLDVAEKIAHQEDIPDDMRDLDLAFTLAESVMDQFTEDSDGPLSVMAQVHATRGEYDKAVRYQKKAWLSCHPVMKEHHRKLLRDYQEAYKRERSAGIK